MISRPEFMVQFKKFCAIREHVPPQEYEDIVFERVRNLTTEELKFVCDLILDTCPKFPTVADWVRYRGVALEKRVRKEIISEESVKCKECRDLGQIKIKFDAGGIETIASCTCDKGKPEFPATAMIKASYKVLDWDDNAFKPKPGENLDDIVQRYNRMNQRTKDFWANNQHLLKG